MGNSNSSVENDYLEQIKKIDEDEKTRTDVLLIKSVKELVGRVEKLEKEKQNKLIYQLNVIGLKFPTGRTKTSSVGHLPA